MIMIINLSYISRIHCITRSCTYFGYKNRNKHAYV